ncbi:MAG: PIN domain-containing protein [Methanosarcinales archaeon]|nr:PIN domain-containing protein [Methanosarcinales archaeon]
MKLVFSAILLSECARGLKKAGWENNDIFKTLDMLDMIVNLCGIEIIPVDKIVVKSAQRLIIEHSIYSADAIHAVTAILMHSDFFISSDKHHTNKNFKRYMANKGVKVLRLSEIHETIIKDAD